MKVTHNTDSRIVLEQTPWILASLLFGFAIFAAGFVMIAGGGWFTLLLLPFLVPVALVARRIKVILDKSDGMMEVRVRSVLGFSVRRYALNKVDAAYLEKGSDSKSNTAVALRPKSGEKIALSSIMDNMSGRNALSTKLLNNWLADWQGRGLSDQSAE